MSPFCLQICDRPYPRFCLLVPGCCCCSVTQSSDSLWSHGCSMPGFSALHHLLELSQTHVLWVSDGHPTISSSVIPFSSYLQFFRASGSFLMSQLFASRGQSIGAPASVASASGCFLSKFNSKLSITTEAYSGVAWTVPQHQWRTWEAI